MALKFLPISAIVKKIRLTGTRMGTVDCSSANPVCNAYCYFQPHHSGQFYNDHL